MSLSEDWETDDTLAADDFNLHAEYINDLRVYAGLDTVGTARAVFIENGGTIPVGTPEYTIVIELEA